MKRKYLIIPVFSLLVFFLSVYTIVEIRKPVPPSTFETEVLFFSSLPHTLNALHWIRKFQKKPVDYYLVRTVEEIEKALLLKPTAGYLWLWDAKLRKMLGMRYKSFVETALWIDPYRIKHEDLLDLLTPGEITSSSEIYRTNLLDKLVLLNRNWNFFKELFEKIWQDRYGKKFLLKWVPGTKWGKEYLATFLALKGYPDRSVTILEELKGERINWRPLWALIKVAEEEEGKGERKVAEKLLLKVYEMQPYFDNIGVRIFNFYYRAGEKEKAMKFYREYTAKYGGYVAAERLKRYVKRLMEK